MNETFCVDGPSLRVNSQDGACKKLIAGVLLQALKDHCDGLDIRGERAFNDEPYHWLTSDDESPFSYLWCCDVLGLAPDRIHPRLTVASLVWDAQERMARERSARIGEWRKPGVRVPHRRGRVR